MDPALLIPIIALMIPLTIVTGRFVIQPIVNALGKLADKQPTSGELANMAGRLAATEERLENIERVLYRLEEAQSFHRELRAPSRPPESTEG